MLDFSPIDLDQDAALCVAFRRDSYVCGFGNDERFFEENGPGGSGYLDWLAARIAKFPKGHVHARRNGSIVGQLEMIVLETKPTLGYVNLFYLVPEVRGSDAGDSLHDYVVQLSQRQGVDTLRLSASPTNSRALGYYRKHGWLPLGPRPGAEHVDLWELKLGIANENPDGA